MIHATLSTDRSPGDDAAATAETSAVGAPSLDALEAADAVEAETEQDPGAAEDSADESDPESVEGSDLQLGGVTLDEEELAAVTAVLGTLAGASEVVDSGAGTAGPSDRTLQRRRQLGLWGRPGPDSWKHAAGLR